MSTWRDYLADCRKLEMDLTSDAVLFPNDLYRAHQRTHVKVKYKEDKALNELIAKRLPGLQRKYCMEADGFIVRPAADTVELFKEGKALSHCVGSYADRYAHGLCDILFVRRADKPEKPFYTMEIAHEQVQQCRGHKNCAMTPEVREFVQKFIDHKLKRKKGRVKTEELQEVAI